MGTFNSLPAALICPECSELSSVMVEMFFGDTRQMVTYNIGDKIRWISEEDYHKGRRYLRQSSVRPPNGDLDGEGNTECPACRTGYYVRVIVRGDVITAAEPDLARERHIGGGRTDVETDKPPARPYFNVDDDYTPQKNPSLEHKYLVPRAEAVLEKVRSGAKGRDSAEVVVLLIDLGEVMLKRRKYVAASQYYYNASKQAGHRQGGWGTVAWELHRDVRHAHHLSEAETQVEIPIEELIMAYLKTTSAR